MDAQRLDNVKQEMIIISGEHSLGRGARRRHTFLQRASSQLHGRGCLVTHQGHRQCMQSIELNMKLRPNRFGPAGPESITWTSLEWQCLQDTLIIRFWGTTVVVVSMGPNRGH